jgi:hypothetical protein
MIVPYGPIQRFGFLFPNYQMVAKLNHIWLIIAFRNMVLPYNYIHILYTIWPLISSYNHSLQIHQICQDSPPPPEIQDRVIQREDDTPETSLGADDWGPPIFFFPVSPGEIMRNQ